MYNSYSQKSIRIKYFLSTVLETSLGFIPYLSKTNLYHSGNKIVYPFNPHYKIRPLK